MEPNDRSQDFQQTVTNHTHSPRGTPVQLEASQLVVDELQDVPADMAWVCNIDWEIRWRCNTLGGDPAYKEFVARATWAHQQARSIEAVLRIHGIVVRAEEYDEQSRKYFAEVLRGIGIEALTAQCKGHPRHHESMSHARWAGAWGIVIFVGDQVLRYWGILPGGH